jgi:DNA-binding HxlR family transcriptional regulator
MVTELGRTLFDPLIAVALWVFDHKDEIAANRDAFDLAARVAAKRGQSSESDEPE